MLRLGCGAWALGECVGALRWRGPALARSLRQFAAASRGASPGSEAQGALVALPLST